MAIKSTEHDGESLSGRSISIIFQNAGEVSFDSPETYSSLSLGKAAHAVVMDDRTNKTGHMFLVYPDYQAPVSLDNPDQEGMFNHVEPKYLEKEFVFEVLGYPDDGVQLSTIYKLEKNDSPVDVYVDVVALQLLETAETIRTDDTAKKAVFDEIDEAIALELS